MRLTKEREEELRRKKAVIGFEELFDEIDALREENQILIEELQDARNQLAWEQK